MMHRCYKPSSSSFAYYGGRGITVHPRWHSLPNFYADMGERPEGASLDRIDTNGNYEPGNVRWATSTQQMLNRRGWKKSDFEKFWKKRGWKLP